MSDSHTAAAHDRQLASAGDEYVDRYLPHWTDDVNAALSPYDLRIRQLIVNGAGVAAQIAYELHGYLKMYMTPWQETEEALERLVYETLEVIDDLEDTMNIFSTPLFEFLSGEMIGDNDVPLTIKDVKVEELTSSRGTDKKPVMSFEERDKKFVLNKSNAKFLASKLGPETNDWRGAKVVLHAPYINAFGERMRSVQVKRVVKSRQNGQPDADEPLFPASVDQDAVDEAQQTAQSGQLADLRAALEEKSKPKVGDVIAAVHTLTGIDASDLLARIPTYDDWPEGRKPTPGVTLTKKGAVALFDWLSGVTLFDAADEEE